VGFTRHSQGTQSNSNSVRSKLRLEFKIRDRLDNRAPEASRAATASVVGACETMGLLAVAWAVRFVGRGLRIDRFGAADWSVSLESRSFG